MKRTVIKNKGLLRKLLHSFISFCFGLNVFVGPLYAQSSPALSSFPVPGEMIPLSKSFTPLLIKGVKLFPQEPLRFDFIVDAGESELQGEGLKEASNQLIRYFLTALTVPEDDLWVNLSPYEKDRIIPEDFGITEMGRDLLAQDYLLKQISASLMYPEDKLGSEFWDKIYQKIYEEYGTTDVPVDTFNKVWVVPQKAVVFENAETDTGFVIESRLKVMLETDYLAAKNNRDPEFSSADQDKDALSKDIMKKIIIPAIEKEVNEGENFVKLRQIYNSLILAKWFKQNIKNAVLQKSYFDKNKVLGLDIKDKQEKEKIYNQYLEAFRIGVFNYVKEDFDAATKEIIPKKYFSGGMQMKMKFGKFDAAMRVVDSLGAKPLPLDPKDRVFVVKTNFNGIISEKGSKGILALNSGNDKARSNYPLNTEILRNGFLKGQSKNRVKNEKLYDEIKDEIAKLKGLLSQQPINDRNQVLALLFGQGNEEISRTFFKAASALRLAYPYDVNNSDPRAPLLFAAQEGLYFQIAPNLYMTPSTESFRRLMIFKMSDLGDIDFAFEVMLPGRMPSKKYISAKNRLKVSAEIAEGFPEKEYSAEPIFYRSFPAGDYEFYFNTFHFKKSAPLEILVYDYKYDGKRLQNITSDMLGEMLQRLNSNRADAGLPELKRSDMDLFIAQQVGEEVAATHYLGYVGNVRKGFRQLLDHHIENFRVSFDATKLTLEDAIKIMLVGDFVAFAKKNIITGMGRQERDYRNIIYDNFQHGYRALEFMLETLHGDDIYEIFKKEYADIGSKKAVPDKGMTTATAVKDNSLDTVPDTMTMNKQPKKVGGIDLTADQMNIESRGRAIDFDAIVNIKDLENIKGFIPVIFEVSGISLNGLNVLLGIK